MTRQKRPWLGALTAGMLALGLTGCDTLGLVGSTPPDSPGDTQNQTEETPSNVHEGTISKDETWKKADGPHVVKDVVMVESEQGVTLTIEPGTEVRFEQGASLRFGWNGGTRGVLKAEGTAASPITFTSAATTPTKGAWDQIYLGNGAASTVMTHCTIAYAGGEGGESAALVVDGPNNTPTFRNCTIRESAGYGVRLTGQAAFAAFEANLITKSGSNPIRLDASVVGSLGAGNTFTENGVQALYVDGDTVAKSATWRNHGIPYRILNNDVVVESENGPAVLTVQPGCTLEFGQDVGMRLGWNGGTQGALHAVGTTDATGSITFTGVGKTPGSWTSLRFDHIVNGEVTSASPLTYNPNSTVLKYVVVEYGGGDGHEAALLITDCKPIVTNSAIRNSATAGIYLNGTTASTADQFELQGTNTFTSNAGGSLKVELN